MFQMSEIQDEYHCHRPFIMFIWKCCCCCWDPRICATWKVASQIKVAEEGSSQTQKKLGHFFVTFLSYIDRHRLTNLGLRTPTAPPYRRYSFSKSSSAFRFPACIESYQIEVLQNWFLNKVLKGSRQGILKSHQHRVAAPWPCSSPSHCCFCVFALAALWIWSMFENCSLIRLKFSLTDERLVGFVDVTSASHRSHGSVGSGLRSKWWKWWNKMKKQR